MTKGFGIFVLLFIGLLQGQENAFLDARPQETETKSELQLELTTIGDVFLVNTHGGFRIYTAPDGSKGSVTYGRFHSVQDAERQIEEWLKAAHKSKISSKENLKDEHGQAIGKRIVSTTRVPKSDAKEFMIIRRYDLNCYLIFSQSWKVAMQLEDLTK
jgi:hypothetical protein